MSTRRTTLSELPAPVRRIESSRRDWELTPHINQLRPRGADRDYKNGAYNCAPAVVAMLARGHGQMDNLNDADLISELGKGIVTREGTTPEGVARMLGRANIPLAGDALAGEYEDAAVKEHLQAGNKLIAQIGLPGEKGKPDSAHYVLIQGTTREGNYVVSDPMAKKPYVISPDQLRKAVNRAPPDGGLLIPVAGPGNTQKGAPTEAPALPRSSAAGEKAGLPARAATKPSMPALNPAAPARTVTKPSMPAVDASTFSARPTRAVTQPSMPAVDASTFSQGPSRAVTQPSMPALNPALRSPEIARTPTQPSLPALNPATLAQTQPSLTSLDSALLAQPRPSRASLEPAPLAAQPAVAEGNTVAPTGPSLPALNPATLALTNGGIPVGAGPAVAPPSLAPAEDPFSVPTEELAGIDTTFHEVPVSKEDTVLTSSEQSNLATLDIDYGKQDTPAPATESKQVTPEDESVAEYGKKVRDRKKKKDPEVDKLLERLENSNSPKDRQLLRWLKQQDLRDPGTGKKTWVESF